MCVVFEFTHEKIKFSCGFSNSQHSVIFLRGRISVGSVSMGLFVRYVKVDDLLTFKVIRIRKPPLKFALYFFWESCVLIQHCLFVVKQSTRGFVTIREQCDCYFRNSPS